jgi:hypothetical protein
VRVNVNAAAGGTGGAALGNITTGSGGRITVATNTGGNATGGSITESAGTLLNAGAGTVALTTPAAGASGIGTVGANIQTSAGTVTASSGSGGVFVTETNGANFTATATGAGAINLTSTTGTLTVAGATSTGSGSITLTGGSIVQNANVSTAGTGTITATATTGSITMANGTTSSTTPGTGDINYSAAGTITLATLRAGGAASVNSTGGSILDGNVAALNVATGAGATLQAGGGTIGTLAAPIDVQVTNLANVNATGQVAGVSIVINGTTGDNTLYFPFTVPGLAYFNGVPLAPLSPPLNSPGSSLGALLEPIQGMIVSVQESGSETVGVTLAPPASVMLSACETSTTLAADELLSFCQPDSD